MTLLPGDLVMLSQEWIRSRSVHVVVQRHEPTNPNGLPYLRIFPESLHGYAFYEHDLIKVWVAGS